MREMDFCCKGTGTIFFILYLNIVFIQHKQRFFFSPSQVRKLVQLIMAQNELTEVATNKKSWSGQGTEMQVRTLAEFNLSSTKLLCNAEQKIISLLQESTLTFYLISLVCCLLCSHREDQSVDKIQATILCTLSTSASHYH